MYCKGSLHSKLSTVITFFQSPSDIYVIIAIIVLCHLVLKQQESRDHKNGYLNHYSFYADWAGLMEVDGEGTGRRWTGKRLGL